MQEKINFNLRKLRYIKHVIIFNYFSFNHHLKNESF